MTQLQACVGPSLTRVHIREVGGNPHLTICEATAFVQDYRWRLLGEKICVKCAKQALKILACETLTARDIGVSEIT